MIIYGKNSVLESLKSDLTINKLMILKNGHGFEKIIELAKEKGVRIEFVERNILDKQIQNNQGVVAFATDFKYSTVDEILQSKKGEHPFVVILDGIEDPHNLGAIIRSAECAGVDGIIIPSRRAVQVNETVIKTSVGAINNVKIASVVNINQSIDYLKKQGLWIYGFDMGGKNVYSQNLNGPIGIVIGGEGKGISKLTLEKCDEVVSFPLFGKINSLNASVACGLALYEVVRQRLEKWVMLNLTNEELIKKIKQGDEYAVEVLFERFNPLVQKIARSYFLFGAEYSDIVQEALVGLYKACITYDEKSETPFKTYASICMRRNIISAVKKANRKKNKSLNDSIAFNDIASGDEEENMLFVPNFVLNPDEEIIQRENLEEIKKLIVQKLSSFEVKVLNEYLKGLSYEDMAQKLNVSKKSVDNALSRIKNKLQFLTQNKKNNAE